MTKKTDTPAIRFKGFSDTWEQRKAKDLCSISTGKSNTQDRVDDGIYPFYVRSPIVEHSNRYLFDEEAVLTVGDGVGTGKVFHYVNGKYDLHQRVYRMFDFSKEITAKYFYYYFSNHFYDRVMAMTAKTSVDSVRYEMIADMDIALPKVKEQMAISAYFEQLDNLITLHQRKYEKLHNIKKSMLEKMFPKNGSNVPEIRFKGFTEAWEQRKLGDVAKYRNGKAHENDISEQGKFIVVNSKFVSTNGEVRKFSNKQIEPLFKNEIAFVLSDVPNGRAIARTFLVDKNDKYTLNQRIAGITPIEGTCPYFLHILMNRNKYFLQFDDGAKQTNLSVDDVIEFAEYYPSSEEQQQIGNFFRQLDNLITLHQRELEKLQNIKKSMLEKMFV